MKYRAQAPLRIDFGGGWTDVPAFSGSDPGGGAVLNAAIAVYATGYIIRQPELPGSGWNRMIGADRNVVRYQLDAPSGAGLGASAAQTLLWLTLVKTTIANISERRELAERARRIEGELGILGGKQDHYASAVGGICYMTFGPETVVENVQPGFPFTDQFERRLVLMYTGRRRLSGEIHEAVWNRYQSGDSAVTTALQNMRVLAAEMRQALMAHELSRFGELMNQNWAAQKALHPMVTNDRLDRLVELGLRSGAIGAKATGAGGGGCLLFLAGEGQERRLTRALTGAGATHIPFTFDWYGVHLKKG